MSPRIKIMVWAFDIRMKNGENIDSILNSYPNLTDAEKIEIVNTIKERGI